MRTGSRIAHFEIVAPIGAGGMGEVYRARDTRLDREVALKLLPTGGEEDEAARARLLREARLASKLNHPNVCTIHEVGEADGRAFIAMELVEGHSLAERLARGPLPTDEVLRCGQEIAEAVAHAHGHGVVHRDLKSANVVITLEGHAKVLDFGLAKRLGGGEPAAATTLSQPSLTEPGAVAGTLAYMAPEQLLGRPADERSDIWAVGVVLYEMATGALPFRERLSTAEIDHIINRAPSPPSRLRHGVPPEIEQAILKCLEKDPANRYQSARDLAVDLRRFGSRIAAPPLRGRASAWRRPVLVGPVVAVLIAALGAAAYLALRRNVPSATPPAGKVMLAVLPVDNLSGDPEQEYFSDGLTEEMIAQVARLQPRRLGVIARTSAMRYKRTAKAVDEIGRELGVGYVLESSVRREGKRVRITAQLIQVRDQTHLWAESYERDLAGVLAIQSEVSEKVARSLAVELLPGEQARMAAARPPDPRAHEFCLRGRYHWYRRTAEDLVKATEYFRAATDADPTYAVAWAGLADTYNLYSFYGVSKPKESFPEARAAAQKALGLDPTLIEAQTALAFISFYYDWEWASAERQLTQILEAQPGYAIARQWHAEYLVAMGRTDAAIAEIKRAQEADPLSPLMRTMEAYVFFFGGRFREAVDAARRALQLDPNYRVAHGNMGNAYEGLGMHEEALGEYRKAEGASLGKPSDEMPIAFVYARSGRRSAADRILARVLDPGWRGEEPAAAQVAAVQAALGRRDEAIAWLERAYDEREFLLTRIMVDWRFDPLRSDPRFQAVVARMNFPGKPGP